MAGIVRRALFEVAPKASWTDKLRQAAGALKSFSITVAPDGSVTAGVDIEPLEGTADSGNLSDDLTDLLVALGEAAQGRPRREASRLRWIGPTDKLSLDCARFRPFD